MKKRVKILLWVLGVLILFLAGIYCYMVYDYMSRAVKGEGIDINQELGSCNTCLDEPALDRDAILQDLKHIRG